jgi:hypothetical protein
MMRATLFPPSGPRAPGPLLAPSLRGARIWGVCPELTRIVRCSLHGLIGSTGRAYLWALGLIFGLALAGRLVFLFEPMRYDEATTFTNYASRSLFTVLTDYSAPNNHIFHTLLVRLSYLLLGNRPWVIRLPALLAGVLLVPLSYLVIRRFYNAHAALFTASLVGSSSPLIEYSVNARGYTWIAVFFLATLVAVGALVRRHQAACWWLFGVSSVLGFYTIPIMLYPFGIAVTWFLLSAALQPTPQRGRQFVPLLYSLLLIALAILVLYLPVIAVSGVHALIGNRYVVPLSGHAFAAGLPYALQETWAQWQRDLPAGLNLLLVGGFVTAHLFHRRLARAPIPLMLAVVAWCTPLLLAQRALPFPRIWIFVLPLYLGVASAGVVDLVSRGAGVLPQWMRTRLAGRQSVALAMLAVMLSGWLTLTVVTARSIDQAAETGRFRDAEAVALFLKGYLRPGDAVVTEFPAGPPLAYYFHRHHLDQAYLNPRAAPSTRLLVVINAPGNLAEESLRKRGWALPVKDYHGPGERRVQEVLGRRGWSLSGLCGPTEIRRYQSAILYELQGE